MDLYALVRELGDELRRHGVLILYDDLRVGPVPELGYGPRVPLDVLEQGVEDGLLHGVARGDPVGVVPEELVVPVGLVRVVDGACGDPHGASAEHLPSLGPRDGLTHVPVEDGYREDEVLGVDGHHDVACLLVCPVDDLVGVAHLGAVPLQGLHDGGCQRLLPGDALAVVVLRLAQGGLLPVHREHRYPDVVLAGDVLGLPEAGLPQQGHDPAQGLLRGDDPYSGVRRAFGAAFESECHMRVSWMMGCRVMVVAPFLFQVAFN